MALGMYDKQSRSTFTSCRCLLFGMNTAKLFFFAHDHLLQFFSLVVVVRCMYLLFAFGMDSMSNAKNVMTIKQMRWKSNWKRYTLHTHTHHPYSYKARVIFRFFPFFSFVCVCFFHSFFHVDRVDHLSSVWNIYYIYGRHMYTEHCTTLYNSV